MNTMDEKLLKYFDGEMTTAEKFEFEQLLKENPSLQKKLNDLKKVSSAFSFYSKAEEENVYQAAVTFNKKSKKESFIKKIFPTPAYLYSTAGVFVLLIMFLLVLPQINKPKVNDAAKIASELKESEISDALSNYREYYNSEKTADAISDSAVNGYYLDEINKHSDEVSGYLSGTDNYTGYTGSVINSVSPEEAEQIYKELLNKKIL